LTACAGSSGEGPVPGPLPSEDANAAAWPGTFAIGQANLNVTGDVEAEMSLVLQTGSGPFEVSPAPPRPVFNLQWSDLDGFRILSVIAEPFEGTRSSSDALRIGFSYSEDAGDPGRFFASRDGSCSVTIHDLTATSLRGEIECRDLATPDSEVAQALVDLSGTFDAGA
jgi:hypothetical protein